MAGFAHLHVHTEYSLLDGMGKIDELVSHAKQMGMDALAITDHGTMYGAIEFYNKARSAGIKPLVGCEVYVAQGGRGERNGREHVQPWHLVLLARNETGYKNLIRLTTRAHLEGFYYKPRVDHEILREHSEGLIALSACLSGEIPRAVQSHDMDRACEAVRWHQETFGRDGFYLELQRHAGQPEQEETNQGIVALSRKLAVPLVATNDVHYVRREDAATHEVLLCIQTGTTMDDVRRMRMGSDDFYLTSEQEMRSLFAEFPEALDNTCRIAASCDLQLSNEGYHLPHFQVPDGLDAQSYLAQLCEEGIARRYAQVTPVQRARLEHELAIIHQMGFDQYFLIVWDLVRHARSAGIWWNVRGSAAGSIVAYSLGLTNLDPLSHGLIFERFLNPGRVTMPDIDLDFPDDRRMEMIAYSIEKYGADRVAQIATFGTLAARAAIRDVGRALSLPYGDVDRLAKLVPAGPKVKLKDALESSEELRNVYEQDEYIRGLLDHALRLEGVSRHVSTHAAGVVIADQPLTEYVPVQRVPRGEDLITQYPMDVLEGIGLLKIDFLGLATLTILREAVRLVNERHGTAYDLGSIPVDDPAIYQLLSSGDVIGVFQVESGGMKRVLEELKPTSFDDVVAVISLYRPGPMQFIDSYVARKHGREKVEFIHPSLEPILRETYGIIVYQEQIIRIATDIAGYTGAEADLMRRAVGKKKEKELKEQQEKFVSGAVERGMPREKAEEVFSAIEFFANYGFNKAHAAAYAVITCNTAFLKAHYPVEYMTALLTVERGNAEKVALFVAECRRRGIQILPPDVNRSDIGFSIEELAANNGSSSPRYGIRFGLGAIKNVGEGPLQSIIAARREDGPFQGVADFCRRVDLRQANRRVLECLIKAGALDSLAPRPVLIAIADRMIGLSTVHHEALSVGQLSLMSLQPAPADDTNLIPPGFVAPPIPQKEMLDWEKELLGIYVSEHPLQALETCTIPNRISTDQIDESMKGNVVTIGGVVRRVHETITRKNSEEMAFVEVEDLAGPISVVVFPKVYKRFKSLLGEDRLVVLLGRVDVRDGEVQLLAESFQDLTTAEAHANGVNQARYLEVTLRCSGNRAEDLNLIRRVYGMLEHRSGIDRFQFNVVSDQGRVLLDFPNATTHYDAHLADDLKQVLGDGGLVVRDF